MLQISIFPTQDTVLYLSRPASEEVCSTNLVYTGCTEKQSNKNTHFQKESVFYSEGGAVYHGDNLYKLKK